MDKSCQSNKNEATGERKGGKCINDEQTDVLGKIQWMNVYGQTAPLNNVAASLLLNGHGHQKLERWVNR